MTANQINYRKAQEEERANRAKEAIDYYKAKEAARHNLKAEELEKGDLYLRTYTGAAGAFKDLNTGANQFTQAGRNLFGTVGDIIGGAIKFFS